MNQENALLKNKIEEKTKLLEEENNKFKEADLKESSALKKKLEEEIQKCRVLGQEKKFLSEKISEEVDPKKLFEGLFTFRKLVDTKINTGWEWMEG